MDISGRGVAAKRCIPCAARYTLETNRIRARNRLRKIRNDPHRKDEIRALDRAKHEKLMADPKARERKNKGQREYHQQRYKSDPEFRERKLERERHRRATDAAYRERERQRHRLRKPWDATVTAEAIDGLLQAQAHCCPRCGDRFDENEAGRPTYHLDHIIPLSKGGPSTLTNLQLLCPPCNMAKGDKIEAQTPTPEKIAAEGSSRGVGLIAGSKRADFALLRADFARNVR